MALRRAYMRLHRDTCIHCLEEDVTADQFVLMNVSMTATRNATETQGRNS